MRLQHEGKVWWYDEQEAKLAAAFKALQRMARLQAGLTRILGWTKFGQPHLIVGAMFAALMVAVWAPTWAGMAAGGIAALVIGAVILLHIVPRSAAKLKGRIRRGGYGWAFMEQDDYAWQGLHAALRWYRDSLSVISVITERPSSTRQLIADYLVSSQKTRAELLKLRGANKNHPLRQALQNNAQRYARDILEAPLG